MPGILPPNNYSPSAVNRQTVQPLSVPGLQSGSVLGHQTSSYAPPSSQSVPSSVPQPGQMPGGLLSPHNLPAILQSLRGHR